MLNANYRKSLYAIFVKANVAEIFYLFGLSGRKGDNDRVKKDYAFDVLLAATVTIDYPNGVNGCVWSGVGCFSHVT